MIKNNYREIKKNISIQNKSIIDEIQFYEYQQKDFCKNPNKYINKKYEDEIALFKAKFNEINFQIYLYNSSNFISNEIISSGSFEYSIGKNMIEALNYYNSKKNSC